MFKIILILMVVMLLLLNIIAIFDTHVKIKIKKSRLYGEKNRVSQSFNAISKNKFIENYENLLNKALRQKNKEHLSHNILIGITVLTLFIFFYFISIGQFFFAVVMPSAINYVIIRALKEMEFDVNYEIEKQLPSIVDNIIQKFSKYNDLKTVIYEVSLETDGILKKPFEQLYKAMFFQEHSVALSDFADKIDNVWIHSLVFILISNQEDTSKGIVIENLKNLREMLNKDKKIQSQKQSDNLYGLALNYFICVVAVIANIIIIGVIPTAKNFFFKDVNGILCFTVGYGMVFATVMINLKNTFRKRKRG